MMYSLFPAGNPVVNASTGNYLNSSKLNKEVADHFGCTNNQGMLLEDQDGTLLASHWERNSAFNDYMTASNSKNTVFSRFTLALLDSTGWYVSVDYSYAEPMMWGKGKGCKMLNISDCSAPEFCQTTGFSCDFDGTGIGACRTDIFSNNCSYSKYYTNTMCIDPSYTAKNLNAAMSASEAGGWNSRCFNSNFRKPGLTATSLNFRCYTFKCSEDGRSLFVQVGNAVLKCSSPGQVLNAPFFLTGTLTCPSDFSLYCAGKKTCTNNCNINGICLDGKCLCTGMNYLQKSCQNVELTVRQVNDTAGLLFATNLASVNLGNEPNLCFDGYVYQAEFGECIPCSRMYNCNRCTPSGCTICNNGSPPNIRGFC